MRSMRNATAMPGTAYARSARSLVGLASAAARPQLLAPVVPQWARAGRSRPRLWWRCRAGGLSGGPRRTGRRPSAGCPRGGRRRKSDKLPQAVSGATQCNSQSARGQPGPRHGPVGAGSEACTLGQGGGEGRGLTQGGWVGYGRARHICGWPESAQRICDALVLPQAARATAGAAGAPQDGRQWAKRARRRARHRGAKPGGFASQCIRQSFMANPTRSSGGNPGCGRALRASAST